MLAVGTRAGLSEAELASWIFGVFFVNGWISILFCWLYRQPLAFFWTIPGTALVGAIAAPRCSAASIPLSWARSSWCGLSCTCRRGRGRL